MHVFIPRLFLSATLLVSLAACARTTVTPASTTPSPTPSATPPRNADGQDARVGLRPGRADAGTATWNLDVVASAAPSGQFVDGVNSDLAFTGNYLIQGNFNGFQVWDISTPSAPKLVTSYFCPASQSDVSVYRNLLFVSGEGMEGRLDCAGGGVQEPVSKDRLRGIRIFDISDIRNPKYIHNVQTCRGSHTHTVLEDPNDRDNVYIYVSGSAPVRSSDELPGCVDASPAENPNSALFRIEVIKVPLANPTKAAIVNSPRIFENLEAPPTHGASSADSARMVQAAADARAKGLFTATLLGEMIVLPPQFTSPLLDSVVKARNGSGTPTAADSAALREALPGIVAKMVGLSTDDTAGPNQCHDITVYPAVGLAGGACEGYGLLLDIRDPANPRRIDAAADSNFAYWHSATFNNDGTKVIFTDEWGGGTAAKCRATDKPEWGANAIFTIENGNRLRFHSYYKLPAPQTEAENCVAHNGSLIPIPGRDIMVQAWYQGGISVFEFTDPDNPREIAYFDRGPVDPNRLELSGSWSVYWYNGALYSSEITRGLDVMELKPSAFISQNEIDAAKTVHFNYLNAQGQPRMVWPPSFALARAYVDQLERSRCLSAARIADVRNDLTNAERATGASRTTALGQIATELEADARSSCDAPRVEKLREAIRNLANMRQ